MMYLLCLIYGKCPGPDMLHPRGCMEILDYTVESFTIIFNNSFITDQVPNEQKITYIIAIFNDGQRSFPNNFRDVILNFSCMQNA